MATRTFQARFGFDTRQVARGANDVAKSLGRIQRTVQQVGKSANAIGRFVDGFRDANAAASVFSGRMGTLGGLARRALNPAIAKVGDFVAGFRSSDAAASAFTGRIGTLGGIARTALNPGIHAVGDFVSGFRSTDAAASAFTGRLGTLGGFARTALNPGIHAVGDFISGFRSSDAAASAFTGVLGTLGGKVRTVTDTIGGIGSKIAGVIAPMTPAFSSVASAIGGAFKSAASAIGSAVGSAVRGLATITAVVGTAVIGLGISAIKTGISYNTMQQQARRAFETVLGSAAAAEDMMDRVNKFADTSPFPREAFIEATQKMLAFGFAADDVVPTLSAIQDAVAAAGGNAQHIDEVVHVLSKVQSTGKLTARELNELGNRGVNAAKLIGDNMGMTEDQIRSSITAGTLDGREALTALTEQMSTDFEGAAEGMRHTWAGATDRLRARMRDIGGILVAPFIDPEGGGYAITWANQLADLGLIVRDSLGPALERAVGAMAPALDRVAPAMERFVQSLSGSGVGAFADTMRNLAPIIAPVAAALFTMGAANVVGAFGPLAAIFGPLMGPVAVVGAAIAALVLVMPQLRTAVAAAAGVLVSSFAPVLPIIRDALTAAMPPIQRIADVLGRVLVAAVGLVAPLIASLVGYIAPLIPVVLDLVATMAEALEPVLMRVGSIIGTVLGPTIHVLGTILGWVAPIVGVVLVSAFQALAAVLGWLLGIVDAIVGGIVGAFTWLYNILVGNSIIPDLINGILSWWRFLAGTVVAVVTTLWNGVTAIFRGAAAIVRAVVSAWVTGVVGLYRFLWNSAVSIVTTLWNAVTSLFRGAVALVRAIVSGWVNGIVALYRFLWNTAVSIVRTLWNGVTSLFRTAVAVVRAIVSAWVNGVLALYRNLLSLAVSIITSLRDRVVAIFRALRALVTSIVTGFRNAVSNGFRAMRDTVANVAGNLRDRVTNIFNRLREGGTRIFNRLRDAVGNAFSTMIDKVKSPLRKLFNWMNDNLIKPLNKVTDKFGVKIPSLPKFHKGGVIEGSGETPIMGLGGEGVLNRKAMARLGPEGLDALNKDPDTSLSDTDAMGGPFDWLKKGASAVTSQVTDWLAQGAAFALGKIVDPVVKGVKKVVPGPPMVREPIVKTLERLGPAIKKWGKKKDDEAASNAGIAHTGPIGTGPWRKPIGSYRIGMPWMGYPGHTGQDFPAPSGTPLYSPSLGTVSTAMRSNVSYGNRVIIDHGNGISTLQAHLSSISTSAGRLVKAGDRIGEVGSTGNSTGPHLHLEGRVNNRPVPPMPFFRARGVTFDSGGTLAPGYTLAYNGTGRNETIRTAKQESELQNGRPPEVRVFIGERELTDIVDVQVDRKTNGQNNRAARGGRGR